MNQNDTESIDKKIATSEYDSMMALLQQIDHLTEAEMSAEIAELVLDASDAALKKVLKVLIQDRIKSIDPELIDQDVFNES